MNHSKLLEFEAEVQVRHEQSRLPDNVQRHPVISGFHEVLTKRR